MDYLKDLNTAQREAVLYIDGPSMVIAGAGSGKTRVLTYKVVHLLRSGYLPNQIMVLTFTNKAANEMRERIEALVGPGYAAALWMGTFHSIFAKILRREADVLGYPSNFTIYDTIDSRNTVKQIVKEMNLDLKVYQPNKIHGKISKLKNNLVTADYYMSLSDMREKDFIHKIPEFSTIFKKYEVRLKQAGAMDFDDLLLQTNILFRKYPEILEKYRKLFKFILVDEYQDTNFAQYLIIKRLSEKHRKICVIGDDAQSIYAFRGARIENIFAFQKDFPEFKLFKLEQNYRSTQKIVNAANSVIQKNSRQIKKNVFSNAEEGENLIVIGHATDYEEGRWVAEKIKELHEQGIEYSDIAILYRMNFKSRIFEDFLRQNNIPYKIYGGLSFYQRKEIKDVLAYLRLAVNPMDDEAIRRIINYPTRGIGATTQEALFNLAAKEQVPIWTIIEKIETIPLNITNRVKNSLIRFRQMIKDFEQKRHTLDVYDFAVYVTNHCGILQALSEDKDPESQSRFDNIQELLNAIKEYAETAVAEPPTIDLFLQNIALLTSEDTEEEDGKPIAKVNVMTVHSAKGLEFHTVFLVGLEQNIFPAESARFNPQEMEEERRLFYVALTRAKKQVYLSYANRALHWGQLKEQVPSQFIDEIDQELLTYYRREDFDFEIPGGSSFDDFKNELSASQESFQKAASKPDLKKMKKISSTPGRTAEKQIDYEPNTGLKVGTLVFHSRFGKGRVISLTGDYPDTKAEIDFDKFGKKKILLKFAKLQILD